MKIKGLYLRGQVYWFQPPQSDGSRPKPFSLETEDIGTAAGKVFAYNAAPKIQAGGTWEADLARYLKARLESDHIGKDYAAERKRSLTRFSEFAGIQSAREVTVNMCQRWYDKFKGKSTVTALQQIVHVRTFLGWLVENNRLKANPAKQIQTRRVQRIARKGFVVKEGVRALLAAAEKETLAAKTDSEKNECLEREYILYCGFDAGLRKREIAESRGDWFTVKPGNLHVRASEAYKLKDREERWIPLTDRFKAFLERFGIREPFMLSPKKKHGKFRYRVEFKKGIQAFFSRHGYPDITIHDMRRSFMSNRLNDGVDIFSVSKWSGDTIETVQFNYGHLKPDDGKINIGV